MAGGTADCRRLHGADSDRAYDAEGDDMTTKAKRRRAIVQVIEAVIVAALLVGVMALTGAAVEFICWIGGW